MSFYFTNAPEAYDYWYVKTVKPTVVASNDPKQGPKTGRACWRLIEVSDQERFDFYQLPRYGSGLYQAYEPGSEQANYLGLPATVAETMSASRLVDDWDDITSG